MDDLILRETREAIVASLMATIRARVETLAFCYSFMGAAQTQKLIAPPEELRRGWVRTAIDNALNMLPMGNPYRGDLQRNAEANFDVLVRLADTSVPPEQPTRPHLTLVPLDDE